MGYQQVSFFGSGFMHAALSLACLLRLDALYDCLLQLGGQFLCTLTMNSHWKVDLWHHLCTRVTN